MNTSKLGQKAGMGYLMNRLANSLRRREGKLINRIKKSRQVVRKSGSNYQSNLIVVIDDEFPFKKSYKRVNLKKTPSADIVYQ